MELQSGPELNKEEAKKKLQSSRPNANNANDASTCKDLHLRHATNRGPSRHHAIQTGIMYCAMSFAPLWHLRWRSAHFLRCDVIPGTHTVQRQKYLHGQVHSVFLHRSKHVWFYVLHPSLYMQLATADADVRVHATRCICVVLLRSLHWSLQTISAQPHTMCRVSNFKSFFQRSPRDDSQIAAQTVQPSTHKTLRNAR